MWRSEGARIVGDGIENSRLAGVEQRGFAVFCQMRGDALAIILKRGGIAEKPIERLRHASTGTARTIGTGLRRRNLVHNPEKACPGLDPGCEPISGKKIRLSG